VASYTTSQSGDWSNPATWGGSGPPGIGDTATKGAAHNLTVDANAVIGTSPSDTTTNVLTLTAGAGKFAIASGVTFELRGNASHAACVAELQAGSTLKFNAANATTPATNYEWKFSGGNNCRFNGLGTSGSRVAVTSDPGGGNGRLTGPGDSANYTCDYVDFSRLGTASLRSVEMDGPTAATFTQTFRNCTVANSGPFGWRFAPGTNGGFLIKDCKFSSGLGTYVFQMSSGSRPIANREVVGCVFDGFVQLNANDTKYEYLYFNEGFVMNSGPQWWRYFRKIFMRMVTNSGYGVNGPIEDSFVFFDYWLPGVLTPLTAGTATSATATTLSNSGAGWSVNAYQSNASGACYTLLIAAGTGAGQYRLINSNTSTTLTLNQPWAISPDATSQYAIHFGQGNPHYWSLSHGYKKGTAAVSGNATTLTAGSGAFTVVDSFVGYTCAFTAGTGAGQVVTVASNTATVLTFTAPVATPADATTVFDLYRTVKVNDTIVEYSGTEPGGDYCLGVANPNDYEVNRNIILPNLMGGNSGTLITAFASNNADVVPRSLAVEHNTYHTGEQCLAVLEGFVQSPVTQFPISVTSLKGNIAWSNPDFDLTGPSNALGPYFLTCVVGAMNPAGNPSNWGLTAGAASHNCGWNLNPGSLGNGYNINCTSAGANDLFGTNPGFVDRTRCLSTWAVARGSTATFKHLKNADALAYLKADPYLIDDLTAHIREGFRPTNEALRTAAHDGTQMGAIAMAWSFAGGGISGSPAGAGALGFAWAFSGAGPSGAPAASGALGFAWAIAGAGASGAPAGAGALGYGWSVAGAGVAPGASGAGEFDWLPPPWEISGAGVAGAPAGSGGVFDATPAGGVLPAFLLDQLAVIESRGAAVDANGAPIPDWSLVSGAARCRLTEMSARDQVLQERDGRLGTHWVDLNGDWSAIVPADGRIRVSGRVFLVTGVNAVRGAGYVAYTQVACREVAG
jgi:hypothetical protein